MSTAGVVRQLPADTPGVPPSAPYTSAGYSPGEVCHAPLYPWQLPPEISRGEGLGYYCTQPKESCSTGVHVCHFRSKREPHEVIHLVVWGGE